jgi:hypothetical protein
MRISSLSRKQKIVAGVAGLTLAVAAGGTAYALISTTASGSGSATTAAAPTALLVADAATNIDVFANTDPTIPIKATNASAPR